MSIRVKLIFLLIVMVAVFVLSVAAYLLVLSPIAGIKSEQQILTNLRTAFLYESIEANKITTNLFPSQVDAFDDTAKSTLDAFGHLAELKILPKLNASVADALSTIGDLKGRLDSITSDFNGFLSDLRDEVKPLYPNGKYNLFHLVYSDELKNASDNLVILGKVSQTVTDLNNLTSRLEIGVRTIDEQYAVIDKEIAKIQIQSTQTAVLLVLFLFAAAMIFALVFTGRIVHSVKSIEQSIKLMGAGDLTVAFKAPTKDEVGNLARQLNTFEISIRDSLNAIQTVSVENLQVKETLLSSTEQTSSSTQEITANAESINRQIYELDDQILQSAAAVQNIADSVRNLDDQIGHQQTMVEGSTAAVTQMISSIRGVTKITEERRKVTEQLLTTVSTGGKKMETSVDLIGKINESLDSIREITGIIQNISSQTNLLAMNAAIEAAHAGNSGKGFSVVADEIRKLAEASATNSKGISQILKVIVGHILAAGKSGTEMREAFQDIDKEARDLSTSLSEIFSSMGELHVAGEKILNAMNELESLSVQIKTNSHEMSGNSNSIGSRLATLERVSSEVRGGMAEISTGVKTISDEMLMLVSTAEKIGAIGETLNSELGKFRTRIS